MLALGDFINVVEVMARLDFQVRPSYEGLVFFHVRINVQISERCQVSNATVVVVDVVQVLRRQNRVALRRGRFRVFLLITKRLCGQLYRVLLSVFLHCNASIDVFFFVKNVIYCRVRTNFCAFLVVDEDVFQGPTACDSFYRGGVLFYVARPRRELAFQGANVTRIYRTRLAFSMRRKSV